jgi:hypothetical protein
MLEDIVQREIDIGIALVLLTRDRAIEVMRVRNGEMDAASFCPPIG